MPSTTTFRGLTLPTVGGDTSAWGGENNNTINATDTILGQTTIFQSSTYGTGATVTSSQAQSARLVINNTSSQAFQLNLPASNFAYGNFDITNNSSQSQNLTVTAGSSGTGGTNVTLASNISRIMFNDGVNITLPESVLTSTAALVNSIGGTTGAITLAGGLSISGSTLAAQQTAPTVQRFTGGSGTYTPTSTGVQRSRVRQCAGGGGGGSDANNGSGGGNTTFGGWGCVGGGGGGANAASGGAGGTGGANGTGTLIVRIAGGQGGGGWGAAGNGPGGPMGGANPFGGAGGGGAANGAGQPGATNTGAGGGGAGGNGGVANGGGAGGAGEYVEFWVTAPSTAGTAYSIGGGGSAGATGGSGFNGGAGAAGLIIIEEFYI